MMPENRKTHDRFILEPPWLNVGGRRWLCSHVDDTDTESAGLSFHFRRARIMLETGWEASIIWGNATYSDNHNVLPMSSDGFTEEPKQVEVAIFDAEPKMYGPVGWLDVEQVNALLAFLSECASSSLNPLEQLALEP